MLGGCWDAPKTTRYVVEMWLIVPEHVVDCTTKNG
jgi:hypothetical protein